MRQIVCIALLAGAAFLAGRSSLPAPPETERRCLQLALQQQLDDNRAAARAAEAVLRFARDAALLDKYQANARAIARGERQIHDQFQRRQSLKDMRFARLAGATALALGASACLLWAPPSKIASPT